MARGAAINDENGESTGDDLFCAEHRGEIAAFAKLDVRLAELGDYGDLFERDTLNYHRAAKIGLHTLGGAIVTIPFAWLAAPAIASWLGAAGLLGRAAAGTVIAELAGAALTRASLAAIGGSALAAGGGGMALGTVIITAAGAALGGRTAGAISNCYNREVEDYEIRKLRDGSGEELLFINGFLQQHDDQFAEWAQSAATAFPDACMYGLVWESKSLQKLGMDIRDASLQDGISWFADAAGSIVTALSPIKWLPLIGKLAQNPWHVTMKRAEMVGVITADMLCRTGGRTTLMGHSLGARAIYYTLLALSTRPGKDAKQVHDVYLLGGAVDRLDQDGWRKAASAVEGKIYNLYSENDSVLQWLYKPANLGISDPIGNGPVECDAENIVNVDCSDLVNGHEEFKTNLEELLLRVRADASKNEAESPGMQPCRRRRKWLRKLRY